MATVAHLSRALEAFDQLESIIEGTHPAASISLYRSSLGELSITITYPLPAPLGFVGSLRIAYKELDLFSVERWTGGHLSIDQLQLLPDLHELL